jgi:ATP adenylyltransferase
MSYVTQAQRQEGCVFCDKAEADQERARCAGILARACHNFVILNAYPYNSGHMMVVPYQHESDFTLLPPETAAEMIALGQLALAVLRQEFGAEGANIGLNIGKAAGAGIKDHVHLHIVPRWAGDTNFMTALAETRVVPQSLEDTQAQLGPVMQKFVDEHLSRMLPGPPPAPTQ